MPNLFYIIFCSDANFSLAIPNGDAIGFLPGEFGDTAAIIHTSATLVLARPHLRIKGDSSGLLVAPAAIFVCAR
jgi:hypothetical protein